ncbi:MAG: 16S rRNA (guanine(527)-N(7))-methyltransferase RsmG [Sulfurospirillum sp.]|nr:MAG: 16S rRNA (guanine(527)-N(7))-methyltransferase RsmG [Sulfurospirillum sp.]
MQKYEKYINLLLKYNKIHKLSGAKTPDEVMEHIDDSLYIRKFIDFKKIESILDIGTGAGFPGMVLAIQYPHIHFTLVEPLQKRVAFLYLIKSEYGLENVKIVADRVENIKSFKVDLITSRAVTKTKALLDLAKDFIRSDTLVLLFKGSSVDEELSSDLNYKIFPRGNRNYLLLE